MPGHLELGLGDIARRPYVPLLKGKQGEFSALRELGPVARRLVTPAIQVFPGRDDAKLDRDIRQLARAWADESPVLVDTSWLDPSATSVHPLLAASSSAQRARLSLIPVVHGGSDVVYRAAARQLVARHRSGAALRVIPAHWLPANVGRVLDGLLADVAVAPADVDLILDAGPIADDAALALDEGLLQQVLPTLPYLDEWRRIVVLSGAFPASLRDVPLQQLRRLARRDWRLWQGVRTFTRPLAYGDYAVANPETVEELVRPAVIPRYAQLRYTTDDTFVVGRGGDLNRLGDEEMYALCGRLTRVPEWEGRSFSSGDEWIDDRAQGSGNAGNYTTWRRVGTVHHITKVAQQLATPGDSSGQP
jgi:T4 beta protein